MNEKKIDPKEQPEQINRLELHNVLEPSRICILEGLNKSEALKVLIDCLAAAPEVTDRDDLHNGIFYREELMSTGIGMGIAVPHVRLSSVKDIVMCVGLCRPPITDYESLDGQPVHLIFMIAAGKDQHIKHIKLLSSISSTLKDKQIREALITASNATTFYNLTKMNG